MDRTGVPEGPRARRPRADVVNVDDIVAEKIAAARARAEAAKRRRAAFAAARQRGLAHRHAAKLRNLEASQQREASQPTEENQ
jgi:hypothetical protein